MEEVSKDDVTNIENYLILKEYEYFSIDLMLRVSQVSKTSYRMNTPILKELQMQLDKMLKKGYMFPSLSP
jgi:hypothetical protein